MIAELRRLVEFQIMSTRPADYLAQSNQGETYQALHQRTWQALQQIIEQHSQGNILIVLHGHTLRLLLHVLNGGDWRQHRDPELSPTVLNTAINLVEYRQDAQHPQGKFSLICRNDVRHLASDSFQIR